MNYFKCLFALVLSVGIVSSAFAQGPYSLDELSNCVRGVYWGKARFKFWSFGSSYEIEVNFSSSNEAIFLVSRTDGEREQFCSSFFVRESGNEEWWIGDVDNMKTPSSPINSRGRIQSTTGLTSRLYIPQTIEQVEVNFGDEPPNPVDLVFCTGFFVNTDGPLLFAERVYGKTPRSFDELKRICDSLPE